MKHRGEILEKAVRSSDKTIKRISDLIGKDTKTLYNWFATPDLNYEKILMVGRVLPHDFSVEFSEMKEMPMGMVNEPSVTYSNINYQDKYYKLLEEQNELLRQKETDYNQLLKAVFDLGLSIKSLVGGEDESTKKV